MLLILSRAGSRNPKLDIWGEYVCVCVCVCVCVWKGGSKIIVSICFIFFTISLFSLLSCQLICCIIVLSMNVIFATEREATNNRLFILLFLSEWLIVRLVGRVVLGLFVRHLQCVCHFMCVRNCVLYDLQLHHGVMCNPITDFQFWDHCWKRRYQYFWNFQVFRISQVNTIEWYHFIKGTNTNWNHWYYSLRKPRRLTYISEFSIHNSAFRIKKAKIIFIKCYNIHIVIINISCNCDMKIKCLCSI